MRRRAFPCLGLEITLGSKGMPPGGGGKIAAIFRNPANAEELVHRRRMGCVIMSIKTTPKLDPCSADRCRQLETPHGMFSVPKHIVRLDGRGLAGWQVRWEGTKYFADSISGDAAASLQEAMKYLGKVWKPVPKRTARKTSAGSGIGLIHDAKRDVWYAEARHPRHEAPKRFYVGTTSTFTDKKARAALRLAAKARKQMLEESPVPLR